MKKIEAIIRTSKFDEVRTELKKIGIDFFSYWDASGVGNELLRGIHSWRGTVYDTQYIPRIIISIVFRDTFIKIELSRQRELIAKTRAISSFLSAKQ